MAKKSKQLEAATPEPEASFVAEMQKPIAGDIVHAQLTSVLSVAGIGRISALKVGAKGCEAMGASPFGLLVRSKDADALVPWHLVGACQFAPGVC